MAKRRKTSADTAREQAIKSARQAAQDAKWQKQLAKKIYARQIKEMRPYLKKLKSVDLRKDLTSAQKGYVTRAWKEYQELTLAPHKIFKTKDKKKMQVVRKIANRGSTVKFDVAFVPTINDSAKISVKNNNLVISSRFVEETEIFFDMVALASDPEAELRRVLAANPDCQQFVLMAGKFVWNGGITRGRVIDHIMKQLMRYIPGGEGYEKRGPSSHYLNWAFGLRGYKGKNQSSVDDYLKSYHQSKNDLKKKRKAAKRARGVKYGKKF
jgi:hypothetical protein